MTTSLFDFNGDKVRVYKAADGEPLFVAKDVVMSLGFAKGCNGRSAKIGDIVKRHCHKSVQLTRKEYNQIGGTNFDQLVDSSKTHTVTLIPESDLYRLVMQSNVPNARRFQAWVCEVVLPTIRKTGMYVLGEESQAFDEDAYVQKAISCLSEKVARLKREKERNSLTQGVTITAEYRCLSQ